MAERARATVRRLIARFWFNVDAEAVVLFQYIFGIGFPLLGLYGTFVANHEPPLSLVGSMNPMAVAIWYWLVVIGPVTCLAGKSMKGRLKDAGMGMQLTGDLILTAALLSYITGTVQVESWGKGQVGGFLGSMLCICAVVTVTRDVRRIQAAKRAREKRDRK